MPRQKLDATDPVDAALATAREGLPPDPPHGVRSIRVKWGDETIQPVQFNGFHVGEIEIEGDVLPGESVEEAHARLFRILDRIGQRQFELKLAGFASRLGNAQKTVRGGNKG